MPGGDQTGPNGMGPLTGRGLGPCGRGLRQGFGRGQGRGMGFRRGFGRGVGFGRAAPVYEAPGTEKEMLEQETKAIEEEQKVLKQEQDAIKKRLEEIKE
ncbi:DUF5320 domain-containing protein [Candidatus Woesearchaeota archaeon]|nr:DUF5320 domain-containing protein [Candidatus Woesearchaeota archaeon]